jgi:superfamily II DNA or RNA helicase
MIQPTIMIRGSQCSVIGLKPATLHELEEEFSYEVQGAEYTHAYQARKWNGRQYVFRDRYFSIGLLHDVVSSLKQKGIQVEIKDFRHLGEKFSLPESSVVLRPYQSEITEKACEYKNSTIEVATGGGKTNIAAEFIRRVGLKTLMIVPSIEILRQTQDVLSNYLNIPIGIIGDKEHDENDYVTVSTWQSLGADYADYLNSIDCMIIDEAQHIGAGVLRQITRSIPATYRLGMSGTLFREDGADLEIIAGCGPKIASIGYTYLIEHGYLVPARFWLVRVPQKTYNRWANYNDVYEDYIIENEIRNNAIIDIAEHLVREGRKVLIFITRIEHGKKLMEQGGASFVYASHPDRRKLIEDFKSGKVKCLISTSILQEGWDLPPIDGLILAGPTKSTIMTLQRIGRALRPFENKKDAIIVDFTDNCKFLKDHFQKRLARYKEENSWKLEKTIDPMV